MVAVAHGVFVMSCTTGPGPAPEPRAHMEEVMFLPPISRARTALEIMGWAAQDTIPLYTDDQRFLTETGEYGPYTAIFPAPRLSRFTLDSLRPSGNVGRLVAMIDVTMDEGIAPLEQTYTDLKLRAGTNCVYLRADDPMVGYIKPGKAGAPICEDTGTTAAPLRVLRVQSGAPAIPAVARFHEGRNTSRNIAEGAPYFGLKCADGWCVFLPDNVEHVPPPQLADGNDSPAYTTMGFGDAQHLSLKANNPRGLAPSGQHAFVVPADNLESLDKSHFRENWQYVATVKFVKGPKAKYMKNWNFEPTTENRLFIRIDTTTNKWESYVERRTYLFSWLPTFWTRRFSKTIERDDHAGMNVPGTARFRWDKNDEDLWVRCDEGCCKVSTQL